LLLVLTGLRVGELLALRWGSVDRNARLLRVCETVQDGHFDQSKTERSERTIPIGKENAEILAHSVLPLLTQGLFEQSRQLKRIPASRLGSATAKLAPATQSKKPTR